MVFIGPFGMLGKGKNRVQYHDVRELYLLVEGERWAYTCSLAPHLGQEVRAFAQAINYTARQYQTEHTARQPPPPQAAAPETSPQADPVARLRELASLHTEGVLTDEEFAEQKAALLRRMKND